jgi:hypothetical protein
LHFAETVYVEELMDINSFISLFSLCDMSSCKDINICLITVYQCMYAC